MVAYHIHFEGLLIVYLFIGILQLLKDKKECKIVLENNL